MQLRVLMTVATFSPIALEEVVSGLGMPDGDVRSTIAELQRYRLVQEINGEFVLTRQGNAGIGRSGLRKVRDVSRLLYLWRRQH